jgi:hypothetical protein
MPVAPLGLGRLGGRLPLARREWIRDSLQMEARLRAYFPQRSVASWRAYSELIDMTLGVVTGAEQPSLLEGPSLTTSGAGIVPDRPFRDLDGLYRSRAQFGRARRSHRTRLARVSKEEFLVRLSFMEGSLPVYAEVIEQEVLAAHVYGYSTSWHDLLHDLVP